MSDLQGTARGPAAREATTERIAPPDRAVAYEVEAATRRWDLGLSIVEALASADGGRVDVASRPGSDAVLLIAVPRAVH